MVPFQEEGTVKTIFAVAMLILANPIFAKEKEQTLAVKQDVPLGLSYYYPTNVPDAKSDGHAAIKFYPYLIQKGTQHEYHLVLSTRCIGNCGSFLSHPSIVTVDGQQFEIPPNAMNKVTGIWTATDLFSLDMSTIVPKIAAGKDVWLIVVLPQGQNLVRHNVHLTPEQIQSFKLVVDKSNELNPTSTASATTEVKP
jgi:hypothetical protein